MSEMQTVNSVLKNRSPLIKNQKVGRFQIPDVTYWEVKSKYSSLVDQIQSQDANVKNIAVESLIVLTSISKKSKEFVVKLLLEELKNDKFDPSYILSQIFEVNNDEFVRTNFLKESLYDYWLIKCFETGILCVEGMNQHLHWTALSCVLYTDYNTVNTGQVAPYSCKLAESDKEEIEPIYGRLPALVFY
jgi:hypothetical protein